jgi:hippurate hydrolase
MHREPEVGLDLPRTQQKVLAALAGLGLRVDTGSTSTSVTAVLTGAVAGPTVLLRADMDALPLTEQTGLEYASTVPGAMHACGHDLHTAILVGAAELLATRRAQLAGTVLFMFQPGEEGHDGAARMLKEGLLTVTGQQPVAAFGLHVLSSRIPVGVFATRAGPLTAASAGLTVTVRGTGGHGAVPHTARDPVPVLCETVLALQTMVTRQFDVFDPVVLTVGLIEAGTSDSIIPETAVLRATLRSFSDQARGKLREAATRTCTGIAAAHGLIADVDYVEAYPVTVNDPDRTDLVAQRVAALFGPERFAHLPHPLAVSEDFARILEKVPGALVFLGACAPHHDPTTAPGNHSPVAEFDDSVIEDGAALLADLALSVLH